tara:strand:+ start:165 stop:386 length:222 start_codon:yes stop_codon:yes gene_type:complete
MSNETETVKRGHVLKFEEELRPDEVSKLGDRIEFHLGFMAINMGSGRTEDAQEQLRKLLEIAQQMKSNGEYQI